MVRLERNGTLVGLYAGEIEAENAKQEILRSEGRPRRPRGGPRDLWEINPPLPGDEPTLPPPEVEPTAPVPEASLD
jgi:hypothetical protein